MQEEGWVVQDVCLVEPRNLWHFYFESGQDKGIEYRPSSIKNTRGGKQKYSCRIIYDK